MSASLCFTQPAGTLIAHPPLSAAQIAVHPLAIMSMSDHWTRSVSTPQGSTLGVLLGHFLDGKISVVASFEVLVDRQCESHVSILEEKVREHTERMQEVYQGVDVVGWYSFGDRLSPSTHPPLHSRLGDLFQNDGLLLLLMDPSTKATGAAGSKQTTLPLYVFECRNKSKDEFQSVAFAVEAEELESIAINAAIQAEQQASSDPNAAMTAASTRLSDAAAVLKQCIRVITTYLAAVETGKVEPDVELLRRIGTLCNRLPTDAAPSPATTSESTSQLSVAQQREHVNSLMTLYLGVLGQLQNSATNLAAEVQMIAPDSSRFHFRR